MSKREESKYKINRRLGVNLWGSAKSPLNRREYGPGQQGQRRKKPSDYGTQLAAKQKLKGYYGNIGERQFRRLYEEAVRRQGDTGENLVGLLERRLDATVYRMKLAPTPFAARQLVNHGHVLVNGRRLNIPSYQMRDGDEIELKPRAHEMALSIDPPQSSARAAPGPGRLRPLAAGGRAGAGAARERRSAPWRGRARGRICIPVIAVLRATPGEATLGEPLRDSLAERGAVPPHYAHAISMAV